MMFQNIIGVRLKYYKSKYLHKLILNEKKNIFENIEN